MNGDSRSSNFDIKMWDGLHAAIPPDVRVFRDILNHVLNIQWIPIRAPSGPIIYWVRTKGSLEVINSQTPAPAAQVCRSYGERAQEANHAIVGTRANWTDLGS